MMDECSARQPAPSFAALLRLLRTEARLTQEELAEKAGLSTRSISDLERGVSRAARKETARLLADALAMADPVRTAFMAAARGRVAASDVLAAMDRLQAGAPPAAPLQRSRNDSGFDFSNARIEQLIDAIAAAAGTGSAIVGIWLIGPATVPASDTTLPAPGPAPLMQPRTSRLGQPGMREPGLRLHRVRGHPAQMSARGSDRNPPGAVTAAPSGRSQGRQPSQAGRA